MGSLAGPFMINIITLSYHVCGLGVGGAHSAYKLTVTPSLM